MFETETINLFPIAPPGWVFAKSFIEKLFCKDIANARASDRASAQMILDVGARLCGHASLVTDASREILEYWARDEDKLPVIDIDLPLPTAEVVATATYAAVAAVATTTLATPFFDKIKKQVQKFLQKKVDKWKQQKQKKKSQKDSSVN